MAELGYQYHIPDRNRLPAETKREYEVACNTAIKELHAILANGSDAKAVVAWWCKWCMVATHTHLGRALNEYAKYVNISV